MLTCEPCGAPSRGLVKSIIGGKATPWCAACCYGKELDKLGRRYSPEEQTLTGFGELRAFRPEGS